MGLGDATDYALVASAYQHNQSMHVMRQCTSCASTREFDELPCMSQSTKESMGNSWHGIYIYNSQRFIPKDARINGAEHLSNGEGKECARKCYPQMFPKSVPKKYPGKCPQK